MFKFVTMLKVLPLVIFTVVASQKNDPAMHQMAIFKNNTQGPVGIITTSSGAPVDYNQAMCTLNTNLLSNQHFVDVITHSVRERIPERTLHAPGTGAFGYFVTTHDITHICKAKLFSKVGKKTQVVVRFSLTGPRIGARDITRETSRGMVVKFYTEEGNLDLPGLNTPCFTFKDPLLFAQLSHVMKPNPVTNLADPNMLWDFLTLHPESMYQTLYLLSDYGYPKSYRHMTAYPIHTYQLYNKKGKVSYVRFHLIPVAGEKHLNSTQAAEIAKGDGNYFSRDLYNAISNGEYPSWYLKVQILSEKDVKMADIDVFDTTNTLCLDKYPLHPVGKLTLNQNPTNHFAEIEQLACCPSNLVPGILGAPDKMYEARRFAYREAQMHRLGVNFNNIRVNRPMKIQTYHRDGVPCVDHNGGAGPNYFPNSFNGPVPCEEKNRPPLLQIHEKQPNNFKQASIFYTKQLSSAQQTSLIENIIKSICPCEKHIKTRAIHWFKVINSDLGTRVAKSLKAKCNM